jgi:hypothetical protein
MNASGANVGEDAQSAARGLSRLDLARGLLRIWIVLTVAWVAFISWIAWQDGTGRMQGYWQASMELREGVDPNSVTDFGKN